MDPLDPAVVSPEFLKEGADWFAVFNPAVQRVMDINLASAFAHNKAVCSVRFSPDGKRLAVGLDNGVCLYDVTTGQQTLLPFPDPSEPAKPARNFIRSVAFSPDGVLLAAGSEDKLIRIWDTCIARLLYTLSGHTKEVYALEFAPDRPTLISASGDRTLQVWDVSSFSTAPCAELAPARVLFVEADATNMLSVICALAVSSDGRHVAAGNLSGTVRVWDLEGQGSVKAEWKAHTHAVYGARFTFQGTVLVTASLDRTLKRWDLRAPEHPLWVRTLEGHKDYILACATVQEGQMLRAASTSVDGTVRMWDLRTGETQFYFQGHRNAVTSVDLSADGKFLASGSGDGQARIWSYSII
ncbi:WD40 repeat-like protein [Gloeopeniophorella convolvens]|nr:WD40 repeat-like protein [Gloeopeniophorella convolvens]